MGTDLSNGAAVIPPKAPKERYTDAKTGAHFEFKDMCNRLEALLKKRFMSEM